MREAPLPHLCAWRAWALRAPAWFPRVSRAPPRVGGVRSFAGDTCGLCVCAVAWVVCAAHWPHRGPWLVEPPTRPHQNCSSGKVTLIKEAQKRRSILGPQNSIAFGKAPRREADSQPISQSGRQAVSQAVSWGSRQADRNTQLSFFSGADYNYKHWGTTGMQEHSMTEWAKTRPMDRLAPVRFPAGGLAIAGSADRSTSSSYHTRPWFKSFQLQTFDPPPKKWYPVLGG